MAPRTRASGVRSRIGTGPTRTSGSSACCSASRPGLIEPYDKPWLFPQALEIAQRVVRPVEDGGKIAYDKDVDPREVCNMRYLTLIRERLGAALRPGEGPERFLPALDEYQPIGSTEGLNFAAPDRPMRADRQEPPVPRRRATRVSSARCAPYSTPTTMSSAWVKNHKLFLEIPYLYMGLTYRYRPDFVVHLKSGLVVLLEGKGDPDEKDDAKATAARRWVEAVNTWGGLGTWVHYICYDAAELSAQLDALVPAPIAAPV